MKDFLDALASLDFKLSLSQSSIFFFNVNVLYDFLFFVRLMDKDGDGYVTKSVRNPTKVQKPTRMHIFFGTAYICVLFLIH